MRAKIPSAVSGSMPGPRLSSSFAGDLLCHWGWGFKSCVKVTVSLLVRKACAGLDANLVGAGARHLPVRLVSSRHRRPAILHDEIAAVVGRCRLEEGDALGEKRIALRLIGADRGRGGLLITERRALSRQLCWKRALAIARSLQPQSPAADRHDHLVDVPLRTRARAAGPQPAPPALVPRGRSVGPGRPPRVHRLEGTSS